MTVRWAGVNPLFDSPWGESELTITALTPDLKDAARRLERELYPEPEGPRPARASGRVRLRVEGEEERLGSVWAEGPCSVDGARASRGTDLERAFLGPSAGGPYEVGVVPGHAVR